MLRIRIRREVASVYHLFDRRFSLESAVPVDNETTCHTLASATGAREITFPFDSRVGGLLKQNLDGNTLLAAGPRGTWGSLNDDVVALLAKLLPKDVIAPKFFLQR